jgi:type I site-specific restriction endonuclease
MSAEYHKLAAKVSARVLIDQQFVRAGWLVRSARTSTFSPGRASPSKTVHMKTDHNRVDYLVYVNKKVVGVIEAKPMGTPLAGAHWQSAVYANGLPSEVRLAAETKDGRLPFVFEASGTKTYFTKGIDPEPRARKVFNFQKPYVNGCLEERYLETRRAGSVGKQWALNKAGIQRFPILVAPVGTQRKLVAAWDGFPSSAARVRGEVACASQRAESLRRSLLAAAFSGELV